VLRIYLVIITIFFALPGITQQIYITRNGTASFTSNAPLEIINAETREVNGAINLTDGSFVFSINNNSFKGFNSSLQQEHFYENYMETGLHPFSTFKGKIIEKIDPGSSQEQVIRAKGILDIHGVSQERIIKGTLKFQENSLVIQANFSVLLEDHQIKIPRVVNQKIADNIEVVVSAEFVRENDK
jgi:polyisoprenoid-binding protein YceI